MPLKIDNNVIIRLTRAAANPRAAGRIGNGCVIDDCEASVPPQRAAHAPAKVIGVIGMRDRWAESLNWCVMSVTRVDLTAPDPPELMVCAKIEQI